MKFEVRIAFLLGSVVIGIFFGVNCESTRKEKVTQENSTRSSLHEKINKVKFAMGELPITNDYAVDFDEISQYGLKTEDSAKTTRKKRVYNKQRVSRASRASRATSSPKSRKTSRGSRKPYAKKIINYSNRMFIYGTMKKGEPEHHWLKDKFNGESTFVTEGLTSHKYPLVILGEHNIPSILNYQGVGHQIYGEVYDLDDLMFNKLDDIEGAVHAKVRIEEDILYVNETTGEEKKMPCWMYVKWFYKGKLNASRMLNNYHSRGSHGLPFRDWNTTKIKS